MSLQTDPLSGPRRRADTRMARVVDIGLSYKATLGYPRAKAYLFEQGIPAEVVARVLSSSGACRSAAWDDGP